MLIAFGNEHFTPRDLFQLRPLLLLLLFLKISLLEMLIAFSKEHLKNEEKFHRKNDQKRPKPPQGGSEGGLVKDQGFSGFFLLPSLRVGIVSFLETYSPDLRNMAEKAKRRVC